MLFTMQLSFTHSIYAFVAALSLASSSYVSARPTQSLRHRAQGYNDPTSNGGSMLTETDAVSGNINPFYVYHAELRLLPPSSTGQWWTG